MLVVSYYLEKISLVIIWADLTVAIQRSGFLWGNLIWRVK